MQQLICTARFILLAFFISLGAAQAAPVNTKDGATGIRFTVNKSWKDILAQAKKENKLIFLDAYASWCGPCKWLQENVFTDAGVGTFYNQSFINVKMDMEEGEGIQLSEDLGVASYPTLFFINGDGQPVHKTVGALDVDDFLKLGKDALNTGSQFYTQKKNALSGKMSPEAFHDWVHTAEELKEDDLDSVINKWLGYNKSQLMQKATLEIILDHATVLGKEFLDQLIAQKEKAAEVLGISLADYLQNIKPKVIGYALEKSMGNDSMDFILFEKTVAAWLPAKAALETQKIKARYFYIDKDYAKSLEALMLCFTNKQLQLPAFDMASMIALYADMIATEKKGEAFLKLVNEYQVPAAEKDKGYYKTYALLLLYYKMDNSTKVNTLSTQLLQDDKTPDTIKDLVRKLRDDE